MPVRSFTEAEVILTERRRLERPLLLLIWLGVVGFSLADEMGLFYLLAGTLAVSVNLLAAHQAKEVCLHRIFVNVGVILATCAMLIELISDRLPIQVVLGHYMILIQLCKLFERKTNRDYVQMIALSGLLMVVATLICEELWFASLLVVYVALACYTTMVFTLKRGLDTAASVRLVTESVPLAPHQIAWNVARDWPARTLRYRVAMAVGAVVLMGIATFLIMPRIEQGNREPGAGPDSSVSGYTNDIRLGETKEVYQSDRVVMYVRIERDDSTIPAAGSGDYLRGRTFNRYANNRWSNFTGYSGLDEPRVSLPVLAEDAKKGTIQQKVLMDTSLLPTMFACYPAIGTHSDSLSDDVHVMPDGSLVKNLSTSPGRFVRYVVYSWSHPLTSRQREYLTAVRARYPTATEKPRPGVEVAPRVEKLARRWCRDLLEKSNRQETAGRELDLAIARRIAAKLRSNYKYSLSFPQAEPDRDGVEDFLFHVGRGHCEYFASALTVMCRSLGVQARLVAGYRLGDYDPSRRRYIVRDRDAHAWTEVYTPETDWVVVDATPPRSFSRGTGLWASAKDLWVELKMLWHENVVCYDVESRRQALQTIANWAKKLKSGAVAVVTTLRKSFINLLVHGHVDRALVHLALMVGLVGLVLEVWLIAGRIRSRLRSRTERAKEGMITRRQLAFMRKLLELLQRHGLHLSRSMTLRELAGQASETLDLPDSILAGLVELYYRMRWGRQMPEARELRSAEAEVAQLGERLSEHETAES